MTKSLDGIKKLDPWEMKKYRKIVLDYIGEKGTTDVNELVDSKQKTFSAKKVDGLNLNGAKDVARRAKITFKKLAVPRVVPIVELAASGQKKSEEPQEQSEQAEAERFEQALRRQQEQRKIVKEENRRYWFKIKQAEQEQRKKEERAKQEKIEQMEEKDRLIKEQAEREGREREEKVRREIRMVKEARRVARAAEREKRRIKQQKAWKKLKGNFSVKIRQYYFIIKRNIFYLSLFLVLGFAVSYLLLCLLVLRFKMDNNVIGQALKYAPVPAAFTNRGAINYNDFRKIAKENYLTLDLAGRSQYLVRWLILDNLKRRYALSANAADNEVAAKFVLDKDFNLVGLARINKISSLLKSQGGIEPLAKYADEYNGGFYLSANGMAEKFGLAVLQLAVGQNSDVLARPEGYYIVGRIDNLAAPAGKEDQFGVRYLFIKAQTLEQYLSEKLRGARAFILAD
jgi:hypothetical protein